MWTSLGLGTGSFFVMFSTTDLLNGPAEAVSERVMVKRSDQHLLQKYHSHSSISRSCVSDHLGESIRFIDHERRAEINITTSYSHRNRVAYYRSTAQIAYFITVFAHTP